MAPAADGNDELIPSPANDPLTDLNFEILMKRWNALPQAVRDEDPVEQLFGATASDFEIYF